MLMQAGMLRASQTDSVLLQCFQTATAQLEWRASPCIRPPAASLACARAPEHGPCMHAAPAHLLDVHQVLALAAQHRAHIVVGQEEAQRRAHLHVHACMHGGRASTQRLSMDAATSQPAWLHLHCYLLLCLLQPRLPRHLMPWQVPAEPDEEMRCTRAEHNVLATAP